MCYLTDIIPVKQYLLGIRSFSYENYAHIRYALIKTAPLVIEEVDSILNEVEDLLEMWILWLAQ